MKMSFRWYGETDPIPLKYIRQIPNIRSVVTAVYDVKPGKVWPEESLKKLKEQTEENGLIFDIVESVPVPEEIKLGTEKAEEYTEVYCENIRRCAKYGVKCITISCLCSTGQGPSLTKRRQTAQQALLCIWISLKALTRLKTIYTCPAGTQATLRQRCAI